MCIRDSPKRERKRETQNKNEFQKTLETIMATDQEFPFSLQQICIGKFVSFSESYVHKWHFYCREREREGARRKHFIGVNVPLSHNKSPLDRVVRLVEAQVAFAKTQKLGKYVIGINFQLTDWILQWPVRLIIRGQT